MTGGTSRFFESSASIRLTEVSQPSKSLLLTRYVYILRVLYAAVFVKFSSQNSSTL